MIKALITGCTGQDGSYLTRVPARQRLRGPRPEAPRLQPEHRPARPHLSGPPRGRIALLPALRRPDRWQFAGRAALRSAARRDLQPGRAEPCEGELRGAGIHRRCGRVRNVAAARGHAAHGREVPLLPGVIERDVRQRAASAKRERRLSTPAAPTLAPRSSATTSR